MMAAAENAGPDESAAGQVYATVAVAEAVLAAQATLDAIREEIESLKGADDLGGLRARP